MDIAIAIVIIKPHITHREKKPGKKCKLHLLYAEMQRRLHDYDAT